MSNLSEEEIIKNIKHWLSITEYHRKKEYYKIDDYIQGLLDLYNKEKERDERNSDLIYQLETNIFSLKNKIRELENKHSDDKIIEIIIKKYYEVIKKDYISKDKIKSKIKELNNKCDDCRYKKILDCTRHCNFYLTRITLQELLED